MKYLIKEVIKPIYCYIKDENLRQFYRLYNKYGKHKRFERVNNVKFLDYIIDVPDLPSFIWQFKEIFVDEIYRFESESGKPIIYDCGANIGMSVLYFKRMYPKSKIKAFESDPTISKILKINLQKNNINDIEVIEKAVWVDYEGVYFGVEGADGVSIFKTNSSLKRIESIRLKDFLEKESHIDLLKMDIEGAEYDVILDCNESLRKAKYLFIEYHSWINQSQKLDEILEVLRINNFRYYLENVSSKIKTPFISKIKGDMDLQVNIWAIGND
jgi:FkbM family methyltransferase